MTVYTNHPRWIVPVVGANPTQHKKSSAEGFKRAVQTNSTTETSGKSLSADPLRGLRRRTILFAKKAKRVGYGNILFPDALGFCRDTVRSTTPPPPSSPAEWPGEVGPRRDSHHRLLQGGRHQRDSAARSPGDGPRGRPTPGGGLALRGVRSPLPQGSETEWGWDGSDQPQCARNDCSGFAVLFKKIPFAATGQVPRRVRCIRCVWACPSPEGWPLRRRKCPGRP